jgi:hypothetical protein
MKRPRRIYTIYAEQYDGGRMRYRFGSLKGVKAFLRYRVLNWAGEHRAIGHKVVFYLDGIGQKQLT